MEIVEVDTRTFLAHYIPSQKRIEISKYLKYYPKLYEVVLQHEKDHSELELFSYLHFWIDIRDRAKFFTNKELLKEWDRFREPLRVKTAKGKLFMILYEMSNIIQLLEMLLLIPPTLIRGSDKWKRLKKRLSNFGELIAE